MPQNMCITQVFNDEIIEAIEKEKVEHLSVISAKELKKADLKPVDFLIKNILPEGCSMIAAAPKIGKSWFVLDMGLSVASGETFLSQETQKANVLYLALEDSENRLQDRMNKVLANGEAPDGFYFVTKAPTMDNGFIESLDEIVTALRIKLVIIDTFQKIRGTAKKNESPYQHDYREMGALKTWADSKGVSLFFVHHIRKMLDENDIYNMISGSQGIMGALDTTYLLYKKRDEEKAVLHITGRDVMQRSDVITFNTELYKWTVIGDFGELQKQQRKHIHNSSPIVKTLIKLLDENGGTWRGNMTDLLCEGERITGEDIAETPRKLSFAISKMTKELSFYNNIVVNSSKNGSGGKMYSFTRTSTVINDVYADFNADEYIEL